MPPTSKSLRREAAIARDKARSLIAYAETLDRAADALEVLNQRDGYANVAGMDSETVTKKHRGPDALQGPIKDLAVRAGLATLDAVAKALGEKPGTVRMWNSRGRIPSRAREKAAALKK